MKLLEFLQSRENVLFDQKFNEDILKSDLFDCLLEILIGEDYIVRVAIDEQDGLVFYFSMAPGYAGCLQVLLFTAIRSLNLHHSYLFLLPLIRNQF